jgi:hypothetical protein
MKHKVQHESDQNLKPNKVQKKEHDAGVPIQGECDPNLMASHQELLEYELKCENNKITNPGKNRPKDITLSLPGNLVKKPRLWGPKINAKFGDQAPKYSEDEMDKARRLGETARKRGGDNLLAKGDNHPASVKKPKLTGAQASSKFDGLLKTTLQDQSGGGNASVQFPNLAIKSKCNDGDPSSHGEFNHGTCSFSQL